MISQDYIINYDAKNHIKVDAKPNGTQTARLHERFLNAKTKMADFKDSLHL